MCIRDRAGGELTIDALTLKSGLLTGYNGGAIYVGDGALTLTGCTLSGNSADKGGGIAATSGPIDISDTTLSNNLSEEGGGIYSSGIDLTLSDSTLSGNDGGEGTGGGIYFTCLLLHI